MWSVVSFLLLLLLFFIFVVIYWHCDYSSVIGSFYLYGCCMQEIPGCQVYGQTMTTDHHNELIQMGINPSLRWTEANHKFPNILYCAPPSRTPNYADNVR